MKSTDPMIAIDRRDFPLAVVFVLTLLPLLIHAVGGTGSRFFTDDYCIWMEAHDADALALTWSWYQSSGGRLAQYLSMALLFKAGVNIAPMLPAGLLLLWGLGSAWLGIEAARTLRLRAFPGLVSGILFEASVVAAAPNRVQAVYWMTGILTYAVPIMIATFAAALMLRAARRSRVTVSQGMLIAMLTLAAGLFNEPFALMQIGLIGTGMIITLLAAPSRGSLWQILGIAAFAALAALIILVIAPGNSVRQTSFEAERMLIPALLESFVYALTFSLAAVVFNPFGAVAAFFVGMAIPGLLKHVRSPSNRAASSLTPARARQGLIIGFALWIGCCTAFMLPGFYATSSPPPARSFIMPLWAYLPACALLGALVRFSLRFSEHGAGGLDRLMRYTAAAAIIVHGLWASIEGLPAAVHALAYGREWDARAEEVTTANRSTVFLWAQLPHDLAVYAGLNAIDADPNHWVNRCAAVYFDVAAITTAESP